MAVNSNPSSLAKFAPLGIRLERDWWLHLPLRYLDLTSVIPIKDTINGVQLQVEGVVVDSRIVARPRRHLLVDLEDQTGRITLRFFNFYPSQIKQMAVGNRLRAFGNIRVNFFGSEMVHPTIKRPSEVPLPTQLTPVYPTTAGISQAVIRKAIAQAMQSTQWPDTVPAQWTNELGLPSSSHALVRLHEPPNQVDLFAFEQRDDPAWQRIIFDELLAQQISLKRARQARAQLRAVALLDDRLVDRLVAALPFKLTGAQQRVWSQLTKELTQVLPMNRLLQGDVGSGKTIVSAMAACQAIGSGYQAALMAPTEILADQHLRKLKVWLAPLGVRVAWLSGSLKESEKKRVRAQVASGEIDLLIGTHALIQDGVEFFKLGLAIVDEQHRFGVSQRIALRMKDGSTRSLPEPSGQPRETGLIAHQLMMSATPIPRTLAMSYYADLDVSVIDELPAGRSPILTKLVSQERREEVIARVAHEISTVKSQVYWVCPLIDESEALELQTAIQTYEQLQLELPHVKIGLVHGKLRTEEKAAVMAAFAAAQIDLLVATTVIEVGVDVPRASLMVIEHAERFGLAQLHQLRGRVGRGSIQSTCVLLFRSPLSATGKERLKTIYESQDGFEIAQRDLELRGPGEFLGARQSGQPLLKFADPERDARLLELASNMALRLMNERADLADQHLNLWLSGREQFLKA